MDDEVTIRLKRIYEPWAPDDGYRVLVDRLWPRGIKKDEARLDEWIKDLAPSSELRKWFHHEPERFQEFAARYEKELVHHKEELLRLKEIAAKQGITLLFGAKDPSRNNAVVLSDTLRALQPNKETKRKK